MGVRMHGNPHDDDHGVEHEQAFDCDETPPCTPLGGASCWMDEDGRLWFAHDCMGDLKETRLPPPWGGWLSVAGDRDVLTVTPSVQCVVCGFHRTMTRGEWS